ncbi:NADPH-dependent ferric siderophore reductase [Rhodococcus wratislaviensis]|uniref:Siderophore-interacting protein n=1 Tax=Rhodococcus wratislaviensis TaxID=44752 RepID=A0AB38FD67_RHOWR|nr:siderophore-interacting protein [Rhodococcus wratislaviensis]REE75491.1 NADPH-dependent ferric siderophore reductase [Rhodococcus wratislaviensis]SPZ39474.1 siderophore-interacting protein [Rhodococcus wratislaviensis]
MAKRMNTMVVERTEWLTPHMVRVYLGGPGFADYRSRNETDSYVKMVLPIPGVEYSEPFDLERIRREMPKESHPVVRTYTVRRVDAVLRQIAIDFVVHGESGVAAPWAARTTPGDIVRFLGPGGGYRPDAAAPWHLLAADESGLPALAAALEAMPATATVRAYIEVTGPDDEIELQAPADTCITWIHRGASSHEVDDDRAGDNSPLVAAVRGAEWLDGEPHVFIHGEAAAVMQNLRRYVLQERSVSGAHTSISGYWRRGRSEEQFRQWKASQRKGEIDAAAR